MACFSLCKEEEQSFYLLMSQINLGIAYQFRIFMKNSYGTESRRQ